MPIGEYAYLIRCPNCGEEQPMFHPYPDKPYIRCGKCKEEVLGINVRKMSLSEGLMPWSPLKGPPLPCGFFPAWPWHIVKQHRVAYQ
ncbi:hypothetical protein ES703_108999 [subsurface metagenome]